MDDSEELATVGAHAPVEPTTVDDRTYLGACPAFDDGASDGVGECRTVFGHDRVVGAHTLRGRWPQETARGCVGGDDATIRREDCEGLLHDPEETVMP